MIEPWLIDYARRSCPLIDRAGRITFNENGSIRVTGDLDDDAFKQAIGYIATSQVKNQTLSKFSDRWIGQLINQWVAERDSTVEEAISQLDLEKVTGKAKKTLSKLPRIVAVLPDEVFSLPGLTTMHYDLVTSFGGPSKDIEKMASFNNDRINLLRTISENPSQWSKGGVKAAMRDLQNKYEVINNRKESLDSIRDKFTVASIMLIELTDEEIAEHGMTRISLRDRWDDLREQLTERNCAPDNVMADSGYTPPWVLQPRHRQPETTVIEAEVVPELEDEPPVVIEDDGDEP